MKNFVRNLTSQYIAEVMPNSSYTIPVNWSTQIQPSLFPLILLFGSSLQFNHSYREFYVLFFLCTFKYIALLARINDISHPMQLKYSSCSHYRKSVQLFVPQNTVRKFCKKHHPHQEVFKLYILKVNFLKSTCISFRQILMMLSRTTLPNTPETLVTWGTV